MKRDMDVIRALMLKLEALPINGHAIFAVGPDDEEIAVANASVDQIAYHLRLIYDQGFWTVRASHFFPAKYRFAASLGRDMILSIPFVMTTFGERRKHRLRRLALGPLTYCQDSRRR